MKTKDILKKIRTDAQLSQGQLADKLHVTRQAISRWELGYSVPNQETLKQISMDFDISINRLLGSPKALICQCCGMPLENDEYLSKELDHSFNELYCKWCYKDGAFVYKTLNEIVDFLVPHLSTLHHKDPKDIRNYLEKALPKLSMWEVSDGKSND